MSCKKLLVVDDQQGLRVLIHEIFREEGFEVAEAGGFEEAIHIADQFMPDIALVDMRLGNNNIYDGADIVEKLKTKNPHLVPIVFTAYSESERIGKAIKSGAVYCLEKPFDVSNIIDVVNEQYIKYSNC